MQKKLFRKLQILSLAASAAITPLWACNSSHVLGMGGSSAAYTLSANTMQKGNYYIGVNAERVQNNTLSDQTIISAMQNGSSHLHNIDAIDSYSLSLSYGLTERLTLSMQLPYVSRINVRAGEADNGLYAVHPHGNAQGIGDISTILQYKVYDKEFKVALLAGIKAPTGKTDIADAGEVLEADLQAGSGSWDFFAGVALTKDFDTFSLHANILYKKNTKGVDESQLGDIFTYNAAFSYKLFAHQHNQKFCRADEKEDFGYSVSLFAEINGEKAYKDDFGGETAYNTGHHVVFATVGTQVAMHSGYSFFITFSKPFYQNFNGIQNDINYKSSIGFGKSF
ncbi:transporter [Sulfurimonas hydrogeniphila]|uniref:transporter n=1 Tax=Sulfurimonas hydrogeniphila TaxID=2509341 RepID=UPI00125FAC9F|nr:transporter [Sulfurimonas hydrogeniphila]